MSIRFKKLLLQENLLYTRINFNNVNFYYFIIIGFILKNIYKVC